MKETSAKKTVPSMINGTQVLRVCIDTVHLLAVRVSKSLALKLSKQPTLRGVADKLLHIYVDVKRDRERDWEGKRGGEVRVLSFVSAPGDSHDVNLSRALYSVLMINCVRRYGE